MGYSFMKNSKLIYVLMSFLSFSILFGSFYFIATDEILIGGGLATLSLVAILTTFFLLRKDFSRKNTSTMDEEERHYEKLIPKTEQEDIVLEDRETFQENLEEEEKPQEIEEDIEREELQSMEEFDLIVNEDFDQNMIHFITQMIDQNMFLESYEFRYDQEEIREHDLLGENLYKYDFHPIPLISLVKDFKNKKIIKVMVGMNSEDMVHIGFVPQSHIETIQETYQDINNIKASLSGGIYRVLEDKSDMIRQYKDPFIVNLRVYY